MVFSGVVNYISLLLCFVFFFFPIGSCYLMLFLPPPSICRLNKYFFGIFFFAIARKSRNASPKKIPLFNYEVPYEL